MKPLSQTRQAIVEEVVKRFGEITWMKYTAEMNSEFAKELDKALNDYTESIVRMVEGKKKELNEHPNQTGIGAGLSDPIRTYNQALDDIKEELGK